jgi:F0F1-type ATP synthase membrane subunit b/b'
MKTLTCPKCGTEIPLEEAVTHQIREELQREFQAAAAKREQALSDRELKLAGMQAHLDKRTESLDKEIEQRLQAEADQIRANAKKQVERAFEIQLRHLRAELSEKEQKLGEATKFELELRKKQRSMSIWPEPNSGRRSKQSSKPLWRCR